MKFTFCSVVLGLAIAAIAQGGAIAHDLSGVPRVIDGDTIVIKGTDVRLNGIDAPEREWPDGKAARDYLTRLAGSSIVDCDLLGERTYGREVGRCFLAGQDIALKMLEAGWAKTNTFHLHGRPWKAAYEQAEREAMRARAGIWRGAD